MHLSDLSFNLPELKEVEEIETQTEPRKDIEPAMAAGGRKPHLEYKEKKVKGVIDRVTVELSGKESEFATKLAKKYKEIDDLTKQLKDKRDLLNLDAKSHLLSYFYAEDEVLTRVLETASLTLTMSKKTIEQSETINFEGFYKELLVLLPEIEDKLKILLGKYTVVSKNERSPALRVSLNEPAPSEDKLKKSAKKAASESIQESVPSHTWGKITDLGNRLLNIFKAWGNQYDSKLNALKQKMGEFVVGESLEHREYSDNPLKDTGNQAGEIKEDDEDDRVEPDFNDLAYETKETVEHSWDTYRKLLKLEVMAHGDFSDDELARKFRDLSFAAERLHDNINLIFFDMEEQIKAKKAQPMKEDLLTEPHEMQLDLAKQIKRYCADPDKQNKNEEMLSKMLFNKTRFIDKLSLFEILSALQEMPREQYDSVKEFVTSNLRGFDKRPLKTPQEKNYND
jgi:hypothetical protein